LLGGVCVLLLDDFFIVDSSIGHGCGAASKEANSCIRGSATGGTKTARNAKARGNVYFLREK
jgi:hypothetical protein